LNRERSEIHAAKLTITGRVQGVGFRAWYCDQIVSHTQLQGYVRNLPTGEVEVLVIGIPNELDFATEVAQEGPPASKVESVNIETEIQSMKSIEELKQSFNRFSIHYS